MAASFKTIGIYARIINPGVSETLKLLIEFLDQHQVDIVLDEITASASQITDRKTANREQLNDSCDLLIVVGGDGSMIYAAHIVLGLDIPVLGINRGRLGFLTDIHPTELNRIKAILDGQYQIEDRFLLSASVTHQGQELGSANALNEIALIPDTMPHMSEFEIFINDRFVCSQNSDGLIIATPTGSTAYALSGGGPILHPHLDAMVIVPMFPHSLSLRPIVIDGNDKINIVITPNNHNTPRLSCDSQVMIDTPPGSHISLSKHPKKLKLIHPIDYDYYGTLRSKLHWGHKIQYAEE